MPSINVGIVKRSFVISVLFVARIARNLYVRLTVGIFMRMTVPCAMIVEIVIDVGVGWDAWEGNAILEEYGRGNYCG